jgi:hypothetical protein
MFIDPVRYWVGPSGIDLGHRSFHVPDHVSSFSFLDFLHAMLGFFF